METHRGVSQLFSVDIEANLTLIFHIGNWVKLKHQSLGAGLKSFLPYKVVHLQHDYRGKVVYRGKNQLDHFGRPLDPADVVLLTDAEAAREWEKQSALHHLEFDADFEIASSASSCAP